MNKFENAIHTLEHPVEHSMADRTMAKEVAIECIYKVMENE